MIVALGYLTGFTVLFISLFLFVEFLITGKLRFEIALVSLRVVIVTLAVILAAISVM